MKSKQFDEPGPEQKVHCIRITLTSKSVKNLEKGAQPRRTPCPLVRAFGCRAS